jgi:hypothetical protein
MHIPIWLTLGVALLVIVFGVYRIRIAMRSDEEDARAKSRKGLYAMGRRTHLLVGIVYLLLGAGLVATAFGWNPFAGMIGPDTTKPTAKDASPTKGGIPVDQLPPTKKK